MNKDEKVQLILDYLEGKLDKKKAKQVSKLIQEDAEFIKIYKKASKFHEYIEDLEDRALLKSFYPTKNTPSSISDMEEKYWMYKFRKWSKIEKRSIIHRKVYLLSFLSVGVISLLLIFLHFIRTPQQDNLSQTSADSTEIPEDTSQSELKTVEKIESEDSSSKNEAKNQEDVDIREKKQISPTPETPKEYPKNPKMERLIAANFRDEANQEIQVLDIYIQEDSLFIPLSYLGDSLSQNYVLEIEDYLTNNLATIEISGKPQMLKISIASWKAGYYYWILGSEDSIPLVGRFLKTK